METLKHTIAYKCVDSVSNRLKWPVRVVKVDLAQFNWPTPEGNVPDKDELYRRQKDFEQKLVEQQEAKHRHVVVFGITGYFPREWDDAVEPLMIADFSDAYHEETIEV
jgi:hypothetical protein